MGEGSPDGLRFWSKARQGSGAEHLAKAQRDLGLLDGEGCLTLQWLWALVVLIRSCSFPFDVHSKLQLVLGRIATLSFADLLAISGLSVMS